MTTWLTVKVERMLPDIAFAREAWLDSGLSAFLSG
jgi:hypothetical protein